MELRQNRIYYTAIALLLGCLLVAGPASGQERNSDAQLARAQTEKKINNAKGDQLPEEPADTNTLDAANTNDADVEVKHGNGVTRNALVVIGRDAELKEGETAEAVVVIGGSARIKGKVLNAVVVIGGDLDVEGEIGEAAVAVMGNIRAGQGARINGEVVSVGGKVDVEKGAKVEGHIQETSFGGNLPHAQWLREWFSRGLLKFRPLAPGVGWVWAGWCAILLLYLLIAAALPRQVQACIDEITRRPATAFLMGLLTQLLLPLVLLVLIVIVVGIPVVPFVIAALIFGFLVGKVAILEWLGFKISRQWRGETFRPPLALLTGAIVLTLLYLLPIVGMLTFLISSVWGLGSAVMAAFGGLRGELPEKPTSESPSPASTPSVSPVGGGGITATPTPAPAAAFEAIPPENVVPPIASTPPPAAEAPPTIGAPAMGSPVGAVASLPDAWAFPKANFWERMGAAFLDMILVGILVRFLIGVLGHLMDGPTQGFVIALGYFAGMWAWKGTTIAGIVLGLKVARLDGQPITFPVALVRALAAAFSAAVFFLGFLWIIWDKERQGWHDRIAGTVVVKLPKGTPLVCI